MNWNYTHYFFCFCLWSYSSYIGGFHCRHVGGQNKRKFVHIVCIKMALNSPRRKILLFLSTNMAAMTSHANHQLNFTKCVKLNFFRFLKVQPKQFRERLSSNSVEQKYPRLDRTDFRSLERIMLGLPSLSFTTLRTQTYFREKRQPEIRLRSQASLLLVLIKFEFMTIATSNQTMRMIWLYDKEITET